MKNFKKVVAAGLALLMLALSVNVTFAAESYTDKEAIVVAKVNGAGIMQGTDKGFEPSKTLTRAEAAAIMVRMKGISEDTVKQNAGSTLFTDVAASHWAAGYVNVASNYGIIKGVGANKFAPEKEVTVAEFYTMAVRALNAGQLVDAEGTWPTNYVNFAIENDLAEDVAQLYTAVSTRMTAATIVANTLEAKMWNKEAFVNNGEITFMKGSKTILNDVLKIEEVKNVSFNDISVKENEADATQSVVAPAVAKWNDTSVDFNKSANLASAKLGQKYTVWYDKEEEEIVAFWVPEETNSVTFTDVKSDYANKKIKLAVDGKDKEYDVVDWSTGVTAFTLNGVEKTSWADLKDDPDMPVFGVAYFDADNKKIEKVYAEYLENYGLVKEVKNNKIFFESIQGTNAGTISIDLKDDSKKEYLVTKDGKSIDVTDIEAGDVVFYYSYAPKTDYLTYVMEVYTEEVSGKVRSKSGKEFTVDGTTYKAINDTVAGFYKAGDEGTFYMNQEGKAVMFDKEKATAGDVALVTAVRTYADKYDSTLITAEVKLSTMDGNVTDWMELDAIKSAVEQKYAAKDSDGNYFVDTDHNGVVDSGETTAYKNVAADASGVESAIVDYTTGAYAAGKLVSYKVSGNKVVYTKTTDEDGNSYILNATAFDDKTNRDEVTAGSTYVVKSDAVVFEIESNDETGYKKEYTLKAINLDDLDDIPSPMGGYIADIDHKDLACGILIIGEGKSNIKTDRRFAIILSKSDDFSDDENKDLDEQYSVLYAGESKAVTLYADGKNLTEGNVYELTVDDKNVITNEKHTFSGSEALGTVTFTKNLFINKEYSNGDLGLIDVEAADDLDNVGTSITINRQAIAEDVILVKCDKKTLATTGRKLSYTDIMPSYLDNAEATTNVLVAKDLKDGRILKAITYTDADGETEIIAIIYTNEEL